MAIYTPTGLKIRFPVPEAFALIARVEQNATPFRILMATEGIELVPNMLRFIAALLCFWYQQSFLATFLWCILATLAGMFINILGAHRVPGLVRVSTVYSFFNVWELCTIITILVGTFVSGWESSLAYALSCAAGLILGSTEEYLVHRFRGLHVAYLSGIPLVGAERSFVNACRYFGGKTGIQDLLESNEREITEGVDWKGALGRFGSSWPQVAMHFDYFGND